MYSRCQMDPISHASAFCIAACHFRSVAARPSNNRVENSRLRSLASWLPFWTVRLRQVHSQLLSNPQHLTIACHAASPVGGQTVTSTLAVPPKATKSMPASESAGCWPRYTRVDSTSPELR